MGVVRWQKYSHRWWMPTLKSAQHRATAMAGGGAGKEDWVTESPSPEGTGRDRVDCGVGSPIDRHRRFQNGAGHFQITVPNNSANA